MTRLKIFCVTLLSFLFVSNSYANVLHDAVEEQNSIKLEDALTKPDAPKLLLEVNEADFTPLRLAVSKGYSDFVSTLITNGADVNEVSAIAESPLIEAILCRHTHTAHTLISLGAYLEARTQKGRTPLHLASIYGLPEIASTLINRGAQLDSIDTHGNTALYVAIEKGSSDIAFMLIESGARIDQPNDQGNTPLHSAIEKSYENLAILLIERGADIRAKNRFGKTPLELSRKTEAMVRYLKIDKETRSRINFGNTAVQDGSEDYGEFVYLDSSTPIGSHGHFQFQYGE